MVDRKAAEFCKGCDYFQREGKKDGSCLIFELPQQTSRVQDGFCSMAKVDDEIGTMKTTGFEPLLVNK